MKRLIPAAVIVIGVAALYPMQRWIDRTTPREAISEETLYFASGETIRKMTVGLDGLAADIYWIRAVQYFGRKFVASGKPLSAASSKGISMELLAPLLNIVVSLDPHHIPAYRFGAIFLPERDLSSAVSLLERGVRENPDEWRLYQDLGYIHWQAGDYLKAADWYERGGKVLGARDWMTDLAGLMRIRGGSRDTARAIYLGYSSSEDRNIRAQAEMRLRQLKALDEIDAINAALAGLKAQTGSCPASLRPLARALRAEGLTLNSSLLPVDPDGFEYAFDRDHCAARLADQSTIAR
ncbi:MAG TPA: hypothetical protein VJH03_04300 [Blastocatellia bacterium]|nr:hypothetical protein [Blastocatellia bacterium]